MLTTCGTVVRRVGHQEVNRATGAYIAKVVQGALVGCVARGEMPTSGAGGLLIVTAIKSQLGCWEVLDVDNALGGVWHVFTRSKHGWLPWKKGWDQSIKVITCPVYIESRIPATVSKNQINSCCHMGYLPMSGNEHFHRGYSLRPHKSKSLINHGIISLPLTVRPFL